MHFLLIYSNNRPQQSLENIKLDRRNDIYAKKIEIEQPFN